MLPIFPQNETFRHEHQNKHNYQCYFLFDYNTVKKC